MTGVAHVCRLELKPRKSKGLAPEIAAPPFAMAAILMPTGVPVLLVNVTVCGGEAGPEPKPTRVAGKSSSAVDAVKPDGTVRRTLRSGGVCGCVGWNGAPGVTRL